MENHCQLHPDSDTVRFQYADQKTSDEIGSVPFYEACSVCFGEMVFLERIKEKE